MFFDHLLVLVVVVVVVFQVIVIAMYLLRNTTLSGESRCGYCGYQLASGCGDRCQECGQVFQRVGIVFGKHLPPTKVSKLAAVAMHAALSMLAILSVMDIKYEVIHGIIYNERVNTVYSYDITVESYTPMPKSDPISDEPLYQIAIQATAEQDHSGGLVRCVYELASGSELTCSIDLIDSQVVVHVGESYAYVGDDIAGGIDVYYANLVRENAIANKGCQIEKEYLISAIQSFAIKYDTYAADKFNASDPLVSSTKSDSQNYVSVAGLNSTAAIFYPHAIATVSVVLIIAIGVSLRRQKMD